MAGRLALDGKLDAVTTAPLHKEALRQAGHPYPGHTELLAELCGVAEFAMMLYLGPDVFASESGPPGGLAVVHVTLHTALKDVFDQLSEEAIVSKARLADQFMTRLAGSRPRIGVSRIESSRRRGRAVRRRGADDHRAGGPPRPRRRALRWRARCRPTP